MDIFSERPIGIGEAAAFLPVDSATVRRWAKAGIRGAILETVMIGGRRCTSREAVQRFIDSVTEARDGKARKRQRRNSSRNARRELEAAHGIVY